MARGNKGKNCKGAGKYIIIMPAADNHRQAGHLADKGIGGWWAWQSVMGLGQ